MNDARGNEEMNPFLCVNTATPVEAAAIYIAQGFNPIPVPSRQKGPKIPRWQTLRISVGDVPTLFPDPAQNIGIILGDEFGTADVDCDVTEAVVAARFLLPATAMKFGREGQMSSTPVYRDSYSHAEMWPC